MTPQVHRELISFIIHINWPKISLLFFFCSKRAKKAHSEEIEGEGDDESEGDSESDNAIIVKE
jgi:hypothetical protein